MMKKIILKIDKFLRQLNLLFDIFFSVLNDFVRSSVAFMWTLIASLTLWLLIKVYFYTDYIDLFYIIMFFLLIVIFVTAIFKNKLTEFSIDTDDLVTTENPEHIELFELVHNEESVGIIEVSNNFPTLEKNEEIGSVIDSQSENIEKIQVQKYKNSQNRGNILSEEQMLLIYNSLNELEALNYKFVAHKNLDPSIFTKGHVFSFLKDLSQNRKTDKSLFLTVNQKNAAAIIFDVIGQNLKIDCKLICKYIYYYKRGEFSKVHYPSVDSPSKRKQLKLDKN